VRRFRHPRKHPLRSAFAIDHYGSFAWVSFEHDRTLP
jgi:hypothetical protein